MGTHNNLDKGIKLSERIQSQKITYGTLLLKDTF